MSWLSRLRLNPQSRDVRRDIGNFYNLHRRLMLAFPDRSAGGSGAVRFRMEPWNADSQHPKIEVIVLSDHAPDWATLDASYFADTPIAKEFSPPDLPVGTILQFRLRANPTKRLHAKSKGPDGLPIDPKWVGKRVGLFREEDQLDWLRRKACEGGFELIEVNIVGDENRWSRKQGLAMTHIDVLFEGLLRVTDGKLFSATLLQGIGSAKGLGYGLLSVARVAVDQRMLNISRFAKQSGIS